MTAPVDDNDICMFKLSRPSPVPNLSPKSRSQIQVTNLKSKYMRKGTRTGADPGAMVIRYTDLNVLILMKVGLIKTKINPKYMFTINLLTIPQQTIQARLSVPHYYVTNHFYCKSSAAIQVTRNKTSI